MDASLYSLFQEEVMENIKELEDCLNATQDASTIKRLVHSMKASCRIVHAEAWTKHFETLESTLEKELPLPLQEIQDSLNHFKECIKMPFEAFFTTQPKPPHHQEAAKILDQDLIALFKKELTESIPNIEASLVLLEKQPKNSATLDELMRRCHSLKGGGKVVHLEEVASLFYQLEECFSKAKEGKITADTNFIDLLLEACDLLKTFCSLSFAEVQKGSFTKNFQTISRDIKTTLQQYEKGLSQIRRTRQLNEIKLPLKKYEKKKEEKTLKVTAQNLNRLMGLAGESIVESNWLHPFLGHLLFLKSQQSQSLLTLEKCKELLQQEKPYEEILQTLQTLQTALQEDSSLFATRIGDLEMFTRRHASLSDRLYNEVIQIRMRPFSDGIMGFERFVRDIAKQENKQVQLVVEGASTPVDREVLEKLESPLQHLIRNAIDHGIEEEEERVKAGKSKQGTILLSASHRAGFLEMQFSDDGRGIDQELIKRKLIQKQLATKEAAEKMTEQELFAFLLLPGFTTKETLSDLSGRGVGLDVVATSIQQIGGALRIHSKKGEGTQLTLHLPLTLSLMRSLLVQIQDEPYAFPLARLTKTTILNKEEILSLEGKDYFFDGENNIALISSHEILGIKKRTITSPWHVVVIQTEKAYYGIVVDAFLEEKELVVQELDARLKAPPCILAGAILEDGRPILLLDTQDLIATCNTLCTTTQDLAQNAKDHSSILVVEDSHVVRQTTVKLLQKAGYTVMAAEDGLEALQLLQRNPIRLIITDLDMPKLHGLELIEQVRQKKQSSKLPIIVISYKEREQTAALEKGANYFFVKGSFTESALLKAVEELLSEALEPL